MQLAQQAIVQHDRLYSLGPLIHNRQVVDSLAKDGLRVAADIGAVPDGGVAMVRAHGAGPEVYRQAQARGIQIIDATCPFVARVQREAAAFAQQGYQVLVLGEPDHPEPRAIVAHSGGQATIVESAHNWAEVELGPKVAVVAQTTQRLDNLQDLVAALLPAVSELRVANTICEATTKRQQASLALAREVDVMIVVGGYHSANTRRLAEICHDSGTLTYHVETADEIEPTWLAGVQNIGVTGGASTPQQATQQVAKRIRKIAESE